MPTGIEQTQLPDGTPVAKDLWARARAIWGYLQNPVLSIDRCNLDTELNYIKRITRLEIAVQVRDAAIQRLSAPVDNREWSAWRDHKADGMSGQQAATALIADRVAAGTGETPLEMRNPPGGICPQCGEHAISHWPFKQCEAVKAVLEAHSPGATLPRGRRAG